MLNGSIQKGQTQFIPIEIPIAKTVLLSSPYKGLMLTDQVKVLHLGKDFGVFEASNHSVYSGIRDYVYLHGGSLMHTIRASIDEINPRRSWVTLSRFLPLPSNWRDRRDDRVQPARRIQARINCATHNCVGSVDNLSLSGLGVLIYHMGDRQIKQEIGTKVRVELQMTEENQPLRVDALVRSIHPISPMMVKVGLQIIPTRKVLMQLDHFVQMRKLEIFNELNSDWLSCHEPRSTKDLYF
jgi:hypothetical protein